MSSPGRAAYLRLSTPRGPCSLCGAPYWRHRVWDSLDAEIRRSRLLPTIARGSTKRLRHELDICNEYGSRLAELRDVALAYAWARANHKALPGRRRV